VRKEILTNKGGLLDTFSEGQHTSFFRAGSFLAWQHSRYTAAMYLGWPVSWSPCRLRYANRNLQTGGYDLPATLTYMQLAHGARAYLTNKEESCRHSSRFVAY
jgi:hypothetical protein